MERREDPRPSLDELARDPARVALLPYDQRAALLNDVVGLLFAFGAASGGGADRLLTVKEAAHKLGCSPDTLYKNKRHPCRVQIGQAARRYRRGHRDARSSAPPRARPHLRAAQLAHAPPQRSDRVVSTQDTTGLLDHDRTR